MLVTDPLETVSHEIIIVAAWLVGVGTALANGCTSGHGVCGLSRLSKRSFVAVITFFVAAVKTATTFHSSKLYSSSALDTPLSFSSEQIPPPDRLIPIAALLAMAFALPIAIKGISPSLKGSHHRLLREFLQYILGLTFAGGLLITEMANPAKTISFLDLGAKHWDPSLAFVFIGALPLAFFGFRPLLQGAHPFLVPNHSLPTATDIDVRLIAGSILFGGGWGLLGLCPGPALVYFGAFPFSFKASVFVLALAASSISTKALLATYETCVS